MAILCKDKILAHEIEEVTTDKTITFRIRNT